MKRIKVNIPSARKGIKSEIVEYRTILVGGEEIEPNTRVWGRIRGTPIQTSDETIGKMMRRLLALGDAWENRTR